MKRKEHTCNLHIVTYSYKRLRERDLGLIYVRVFLLLYVRIEENRGGRRLEEKHEEEHQNSLAFSSLDLIRIMQWNKIRGGGSVAGMRVTDLTSRKNIWGEKKIKRVKIILKWILKNSGLFISMQSPGMRFGELANRVLNVE